MMSYRTTMCFCSWFLAVFCAITVKYFLIHVTALLLQSMHHDHMLLFFVIIYFSCPKPWQFSCEYKLGMRHNPLERFWSLLEIIQNLGKKQERRALLATRNQNLCIIIVTKTFNFCSQQCNILNQLFKFLLIHVCGSWFG